MLAVVMVTLSSCQQEKAPKPPPIDLARGDVMKLQLTDIADIKLLDGEITTRDRAEAMPRIAGTLVSLAVHAGDMVSKGQVIGRVVDPRLGYETSAYGAQIAAAQAESARARGDLDRVRYLYDSNVYAKTKLDQTLAAARAADAQLAAAWAQRNASASVSAQGAILAPASGRVLRADVPAGSVVAPGTSIATIAAGPPVLRFELPESLSDHVHVGTSVTVSNPNIPGVSHTGQVVQIYPAISGGRMRVDAARSHLSSQLVGKQVSASIDLGRRQALVVPRRFITTRYGIDSVELVTPDRQLSSIPVQTQATGVPDQIEILSGLSAGDTLFAAGHNK